VLLLLLFCLLGFSEDLGEDFFRVAEELEAVIFVVFNVSRLLAGLLLSGNGPLEGQSLPPGRSSDLLVRRHHRPVFRENLVKRKGNRVKSSGLAVDSSAVVYIGK
jgi:hypothetical protein